MAIDVLDPSIELSILELYDIPNMYIIPNSLEVVKVGTKGTILRERDRT